MKLPDIPDKYKDRELWVLAGQQLVARKYPWEDEWRVKEIGCNRCGECCMDEPSTVFGNDDEGKCNMLARNGPDQWECKANNDKPYRCLADPDFVPSCSIRYKKVNCG